MTKSVFGIRLEAESAIEIATRMDKKRKFNGHTYYHYGDLYKKYCPAIVAGLRGAGYLVRAVPYKGVQWNQQILMAIWIRRG